MVPIRPSAEKQDTGAETTRLLMDEYEAQPTDIRRNGETAIPRDARTNAADEFLYEVEVVRKDECCHEQKVGYSRHAINPFFLFVKSFNLKSLFINEN